jgi:hypothetical protein
MNERAIERYRFSIAVRVVVDHLLQNLASDGPSDLRRRAVVTHIMIRYDDRGHCSLWNTIRDRKVRHRSATHLLISYMLFNPFSRCIPFIQTNTTGRPLTFFPDAWHGLAILLSAEVSSCRADPDPWSVQLRADHGHRQASLQTCYPSTRSG